MIRLSIALACLLLTTPTASQADAEHAVIALHASVHSVKTDCEDAPASPCSEYVTEWPVLEPTTVWLVAVSQTLPGILGVSCGIQYSTNAFVEWTLCASGPETPCNFGQGAWPASGSGNRIAWYAGDNCQTTEYGEDGIHAVAGFFYVYAYSPDLFEVSVNDCFLTSPELEVMDCDGGLHDVPYPQATGAIGFGGVEGHNPCEEAATTSVPPAPRDLGFVLHRASPNPFLGATKIAFRTAIDGPVTVRVFDTAGREVARPFSGSIPAGDHEVAWDGRDDAGRRLSAGVYLYRIETAHGGGAGKVVLIR